MVIRAVVACTLAVLLVAAAWSPRPARADAVVGTGTADSCTEAALDAALAGGGNVTFSCGASPLTITVTSQKTIAADTTIDGGDLITLSGGGFTSILSVQSGATVTVANLTMSGGIETYGYGGAISNSGTLTVSNSTFSGNSATASRGGAYGGAIYNGGTLTVTNSTFSGNSATGSTVPQGVGYGGAISNGQPPGVFTLTVTNSTFSGNSAIGSSHGGAISGTVTLRNTIVANSSYGVNNCDGTITHAGQNLDSDGSCGVGPATNPMLDPAGLANNGGPTETIALQPSSPAINDGDETICAAPPVNNLDQRGLVRPVSAPPTAPSGRTSTTRFHRAASVRQAVQRL